VPGQRLEQVNGNALVGQVRQKCPAAAVAAGPFQARAFVNQLKCLRQAVGVEPQLDAFLAGKEWVAAVHASGLSSIGLQFRFQFGADKHGASMAALGHVVSDPQTPFLSIEFRWFTLCISDQWNVEGDHECSGFLVAASGGLSGARDFDQCVR